MPDVPTITFTNQERLNRDNIFPYYSKLRRKVLETLEKENLSKDTSYSGFKKLSINVNEENKEIYYENKNFGVDSTNWKKIRMYDIKVKINPEGDIIEHLHPELIGLQLFTWEAAMRELKKHGGRLPLGIDEFKSIINKVGIDEFNKKLPGFGIYENKIKDVCLMKKFVYFWIKSKDGINTEDIGISKGGKIREDYMRKKRLLFCIRRIKD